MCVAVPVAIYGTSDVLAIADDPFGSAPGLIIVLAICYLLYRMAANAFTNEEKD